MVSAEGPDGARASTPVGGCLLRDLVAEVVLEVAPEERPLLQALSGLDDATVVRRLTAHDRQDEPLAFGAEAVAAMVTPVLWVAVDQAVRKVVDSVAEPGGAAGRGVRGWFGRCRRSPEPVVVPPLTREQIALVARTVLEAGREAGLSEQRRSRIVDGVVRRLVLAPPSGSGEPSDSGSGQPPDGQGQ